MAVNRPLSALTLTVFFCLLALPGILPAHADEQLYRARCANCHPLHAPSDLTAAQWGAQLRIECSRAQLNLAECMQLGGYLQQNAGLEPALLNREQLSVQQHCGFCHALEELEQLQVPGDDFVHRHLQELAIETPADAEAMAIRKYFVHRRQWINQQPL